MPERFNWAAGYDGRPTIVYGHTPVAEPVWQGNSVCIDTGCVFGGKLTALRWPEKELVSVPAREEYAVLRRGFGLPPARPAPGDDELTAILRTAERNAYAPLLPLPMQEGMGRGDCVCACITIRYKA